MRLAVLLILSLASAAPAAEVYIGVDAARGMGRKALGLPPFVPEDPTRLEDGETGVRLRDTLRSDLLYSRYFDLIEKPTASAEGGEEAAAQAWKASGASFLLTARSGRVQSMLSLAVKVSDLASGEAVLERYYKQEEKYWRSLAHKVADDVVRQLTGRPGIAHTQIAFVNDQSGRKEIYLADYDGEEMRRATSFKSITLLPRWSPDRRLLAFTSYKEGNPDLFLYDMELGRSRVLSDRQGLNLAGGFSPDGAKLAVTLSMQKNPNVFLLSLADGSIERVTSHFGVDSSPTFSPDGGQIAFVSDRAGNPQIHVQQLSTGRLRRLTRLNWCDSPSWSPSGEWIAFSGRANNKDPMDIFLVDVTGTRLIQLTHGEGSNEDPAWSLDSRFIVFSSTRGTPKRRRIHLMDADGAAPHPLADIPGNSFTPSWSQ
ncbi:MAG: hypothetical protein AAB578_02270 [Elusimicrobiota bacterium]